MKQFLVIAFLLSALLLGCIGQGPAKATAAPTVVASATPTPSYDAAAADYEADKISGESTAVGDSLTDSEGISEIDIPADDLG